MRLVRSSDVLQLTGLTSDQLREWTVRRALIQPDVPAQKRGSGAKFSWRTVLILRLAVVLRTRFHVELQAQSKLLMTARELLDGLSFPALWDMTLAIYGLSHCELLSPRGALAAHEDAILLRMNGHLEVLSERFGLTEPVAQLPLFPAIPIRSGADAERKARFAKAARP